MRAGDELAQGGVVGLVDRLDARQRVFDGEAAAIDFHVLGDKPRHGSKAACHPHRTDIGMRRHRPVEHARVEFVRLAVDVEEGPREMRQQHRRAEERRVLEQLVDIVIFGTTDRQRIEAGLIEKGLWIRAAAMRRVEYEGNPLTCRFQNLKQLPLRHLPHRNPFYHVRFLLLPSCCQLVGSVSIVRPLRFLGS